MTPLFPAGAEGVQISQQRMKKETRSTFKRSSEPFLFGHKPCRAVSRTANRRHLCSYYVKMSEVAARSCKYKHLSNKDFRIFGENIGWCRLGSDVFAEAIK